LKAREAIMSSPIHHAKDLDAALAYAPPWARDQASPFAESTHRPVALSQMRRRPLDVGRSEFSGDQAMVELQRRLTLNPELVPEPPPESARHFWPIALRLGAVAGLAAVVAWAVVALPGLRNVREEAAYVPPIPIPVNRVKVVRVTPADDLPPALPDERAAAAAAPPPVQPVAPVPAAVPPVAPAAASATATEEQTLHLDNDEIAMLIKRGNDYLTNGDFASARLLLRRAANGGSAEAALALGASYDPIMIAKLGAVGAKPDVMQARTWYQRAADLGSQSAPDQLAKLVQARP